MKKYILIIPVLLLTVFFSMSAKASVPPEYSELLDDIGTDELTQSLPEDTAGLLEDAGISCENVSTNVYDILDSLLSIARQQGRKPLKTFVLLLSAVVITAFAGGVKTALSDSEPSETVYTVVSVFCIVTVIVPMLDYFSSAAQAVKAANIFEKCFIPVFGTVLSYAGQSATAAGSAAGILVASELCASLLNGVILPASKLLAGVTAASCALSSETSSLLTGIEKCIKWLLGLLASVLVGVLTISGIITAGADTVAGKTMKFVVSGSVPVIGSSMGEALSSVKACIAMLKSSIGAYGIVACAYIFLPVIIQGGLWIFILSISSGLADMLSAKATGKLLRSFSGIASLVLSACVLMMLVLIISATMIVIVGKGTA